MNDNKTTAHVLPISLYLMIGSALIFLTFVTVAVAQLDFGAWNLVVALAVAAVKASLVVMYFMHLRYDNRLYLAIFLIAILFLSLFIVFLLFDTLERGSINAETKAPISRFAAIYDSAGVPLPMEERSFGPAEGVTASASDGAVDDVPFEMRHGFGPIKEEIVVGPLDTVRALKGRDIFNTKCATCHRLDERYTGPPLRHVTGYRSPTFIMNQILDPAQNVSKHPDMKAMLAVFYTIMTNQNVSHEEARTLVEYLRWEATRSPENQDNNETTQ